jgi:hypothetical protein
MPEWLKTSEGPWALFFMAKPSFYEEIGIAVSLDAIVPSGLYTS